MALGTSETIGLLGLFLALTASFVISASPSAYLVWCNCAPATIDAHGGGYVWPCTLRLRGGRAGDHGVGGGSSRRAKKRRYWRPLPPANQSATDALPAGADGGSFYTAEDNAMLHAPKLKRERRMVADEVQACNLYAQFVEFSVKQALLCCNPQSNLVFMP